MNSLRMKKTWRALAGAALAASLVVAPLVATSAAAVDIVGIAGQLEDATPEANGEKYWQDRYAEFDAECYSHNGDSEHGKITDGGYTVTLNAFDDAWHGNGWVVLVVKGGTSNYVTEQPVAGVAYASPLNNGGQQAKVSHWIVCKGELPEVPEEPEVVTPTLDFTVPDCDAPGTLTQSENARWTSKLNDDGTTTWTASPLDGRPFAKDVRTEWTIPDLSQLAADLERCRPDQPPAAETAIVSYDYDCGSASVITTTVTTTTPYVWQDKSWMPGESSDVTTTATRDMTPEETMDCPLPDTKVEYDAWEDGEWDCGATEVTQTREVVTTVFDYDQAGTPTPSSSSTFETRTRALTQSEIGECPLLPGEIVSSCVSDVPYLAYGVTLPEGYTPSSTTPVTITFVNPDGEDYVVAGQPLSGTLLWPGASATAPKMWPGWALEDGEYVETEGNFAWTRAGVTVRFDVNPTYETVVEYPEATALCANPPIGGPGDEEPGSEEPGSEIPGSEDSGTEDPATDTANDHAPALAVTGGGVSPLIPVIGGAALLMGLAALAIVAYRRRQDAA
ncbi:hypothetical protein [Microbacterium sp. 2FI]|uniref:hypothetical protein n=1 Tax=Microbacterium sp. 2FI TaxID=2502193 RepID=UPI0010F6A33A|nr:hypothetical protein [Microbacterium sp. 2FI]